jgi:hypothetical protein
VVIAVQSEHSPAYDSRTNAAIWSVLVEIGQILASYRGRFVIVGGAVPSLLIRGAGMPHAGTTDIDITLDAEALGDGEYARLVDALLQNGYEQRTELRRFQLSRVVEQEREGATRIVVDFLMPRAARIEKNQPPLLHGFAVQRASGAELALRYPSLIEIQGRMPGGGINRVEIAVASIPAFLVMKGFAIQLRLKSKDAYDIYYCIRNYPGGVPALADACKPLLEYAEAREAYGYIAAKFETHFSFGPVSVGAFAETAGILGDRTVHEWRRDAFGQVSSWARALKLRD